MSVNISSDSWFWIVVSFSLIGIIGFGSSGEDENTNDHRVSTELDYEMEEVHAATEEGESDDDPRPEEMGEKESAAIGPEVNVVPSVVKATVERPSDEQMVSTTAATPVVLKLEKSAAFWKPSLLENTRTVMLVYINGDYADSSLQFAPSTSNSLP